MENKVKWTVFYEEFANKLKAFYHDRRTLIDKIKNVFERIDINLPKLDADNNIVDICPFTVFGLFNKRITDENRKKIIGGIANEFGIEADIPEKFNGVPLLNNQKATFYSFSNDRGKNDINNLWDVFTAALDYADNGTDDNRNKLIKAFNLVIKQKGVRWNITMGLFWIRPYTYLNLDGRNRWFIKLDEYMPAEYIKSLGELKDIVSCEEYLSIIESTKRVLDEGKHEQFRNFVQLSNYAFLISEKANQGEDIDQNPPIEKKDNMSDDYSEKKFLSEVYMNKEKYIRLKNLLKDKMNIILQGAPGVGKTFAAKRLCYSIIGKQDDNRVMMIQFHQSYSYEDFIEGYRPDGTGFVLKKGPFYNFCKQAEKDEENDYFFIIDEINRGNLSKIFGELFMLVENDKRGQQLKLLYSDEMFSVPKNVYIIGMMNTADRSLAMLDYALRRRFAFFEFAPAFDTEGFRNYQMGKKNEKFDNLISTVVKLNAAIEEDASLGKGFRIGHSFFCTIKEIDDAWLEAVISYEIVPLLNEYWFDEPQKVRDWEQKLYEAIK